MYTGQYSDPVTLNFIIKLNWSNITALPFCPDNSNALMIMFMQTIKPIRMPIYFYSDVLWLFDWVQHGKMTPCRPISINPEHDKEKYISNNLPNTNNDLQ